MNSNAFFSDLLSSISERGRTLLRRVGSSEDRPDGAGLIALCGALLSGRGEASGTAMAREVLDRYHHLDDAERLAFFEALTRDFGPDREKLAEAIESWRAQPSDEAPARPLSNWTTKPERFIADYSAGRSFFTCSLLGRNFAPSRYL